MSTSTFDPARVIAIREWAGGPPSEQLYKVSASRSVNADRARIFQAITIPEYMETWFSAPDTNADCIRVLGVDGLFSIDGRTEAGSRFRISCEYRVCRRSKLVFSWRQESFPEATSSMVTIRLRGDFERTTVDVMHSGLRSLERQWCEDLWTASLAHLSRLF